MLAYAYCDFRTSEGTNPASILRTLFAQLLADFPGSIRDEFEDLIQCRVRKQGPPSSLKRLVDLIHTAVKPWKRAFLVIDALDEARDRQKLLEVVLTLGSSSIISLFVTSRRENGIFQILGKLPSVSLNDELQQVQGDIDLMVAHEIASRPQLSRLREPLKTDISDALKAKANGMYVLLCIMRMTP